MGSPSHHGKAAIEYAADALTTQLIRGRTMLPEKAANNRAPRCSSAEALAIHKGMSRGTYKPFHHLLTLMACYLEDGVPLSELTGVIDQFRADVETLAIARYERAAEHPLPFLLQRESLRETKLEGQVNAAQERAVVEHDNPLALEAFAKLATRQQAQLGVVTSIARKQLAVVRTKSAPTRRASLVLA